MALRKKQAMSEEDRYKLELAQELELSRLERKYKLMERDRVTLSQGGGSKLAKQTKVLHILKREHKEILKDLNVATSSTNKKKYENVMKHLNVLLTEHDVFDESIKSENIKLNEMDFHIKNIDKEITEKKKNLITEYDEQQKVSIAQKNLEALENKLETATRRFCTIIAENGKLREEINHYLNERIRFNTLWGRLIDNLTKGKKFMLDLIEQATIAYDQRDECCLKLQALKARAHNDFIHYSQEMLRLHRQIDADKEFECYLRTKGQRRVMLDLEAKRKKKHEEMRKMLESQLAAYDKMLTEISEFTRETQLARIADKFMKTEVENFSRYMYINDLNRQMEGLSSELMKLHNEIDHQMLLRKERAEGQEKKIHLLEDQLQIANTDVVQAQKELRIIEDRLTNMMQGIDQIFNLCKCNNAPLLQLLGDNAFINRFNVLLYLKLLEEQVSDVIMTVYHKQKMGGDKKKKEAIIKEERSKPEIMHPVFMVKSTPCPLCIEQDQVLDLVETVQLALKRNELEEKIEKMITGPEARDIDHNVSNCHLPKSRQIIQKRYQ